MNLVERMLQYRAVNGLSQSEFAKRCGVSSSTISHIETDPAWPVGKQLQRKIEYVLMGGVVRKEEQ